MLTQVESPPAARPHAILGGLRASFKRWVEQLASLPPLVKTLERARRSKVAVLAYHNVIPDSEPVTGEAALHLPLALFRNQLDVLERYFEICSLQDALQVDRIDRPRRLRVALTFDDAYRGTLQIAVPELVRRGHPATIFAPSGLLDTPAFWWDAYEVSPLEREQTCLINLKGVGTRIDAWARQRARPERAPGPFQRPGTAEELSESSAHPGIEVAVHTLGHPNLSELARDEVFNELHGCLEELRSLGIEPAPYVAYPYGLSSSTVRDIARSGIWVAGLTIEGGSFRPGTQNRWQVPRVPVPSGASAENLLLRILGGIKK